LKKRSLKLNAGYEMKKNKNADKNQVKNKNLKIEHGRDTRPKLI